MPSASAGRSPAETTADARRQLLGLLEPVVASAGYDLDDIAVSTAGRRTVVRVSVDADGGIDLDAVAEVSRVVSAALDADAGGGGFAGPYVLEVSSPGVDRPLTEFRHWRRAVGRLVEVPVDGVPVTGRVRGVSEQVLVLDVAGGQRELPWPTVGAGRVQVEFNRPGTDEAGD